MKLSIGNAFTFIASMIASVSAQESQLVLGVLTIMESTTEIQPAEATALDEGMMALQPELNKAVDDVVPPTTRNLRVKQERELVCSYCLGYVSSVTMCWVSGLGMVRRCPRALTVHEDLSEEAIAGLNEDDRRRHLQVAALCREVKDGISSVLTEAEVEGIIAIPPTFNVTEKCIYEYVPVN